MFPNELGAICPHESQITNQNYHFMFMLQYCSQDHLKRDHVMTMTGLV